MKRYRVDQFDSETWIVADSIENREVCICGDYEGWRDGKRRAHLIAGLLNLAHAMADHAPEHRGGKCTVKLP